jgi:hypothetical protein
MTLVIENETGMMYDMLSTMFESINDNKNLLILQVKNTEKLILILGVA